MAAGNTRDVIIDTSAKSITVTHNRHTVNELYSYLMDYFDEQALMDDLIPMNAKTPTLYELINGWTLTTYSWDFLYNSAVTETRNNTQNFNIWTDVKTLGAIESGSTLYVQQGTIVTYEGCYPFCNSLPVGIGGTEFGTLTVTSTIPTNVSASGSLRLGIGSATDEYIGYSSWVNGVGGPSTFILSSIPSNSHIPNQMMRAPYTGHFDICLITRENAADIDSTNFKTYCRLFQKSYSDFTTSGGAVVSNVPLASASDPFLTISGADLGAWNNSFTIEWQGTNIQRSAFDGTTDVQEYVLSDAITGTGGTIDVVTSSTIAFSVPAIGYLQIESEVMHYTAYTTAGGESKGTFAVDLRGQYDTIAAAHLAGKDLSTAMFAYNILIQMTTAFSLLQTYNWVQKELLEKYDISDDATYHLGYITSPLVSYTGALWTLAGVWVEGFNSSEKSNIKYRDVNSTLHTPPTYITLKIDGDSVMSGGRGAMYKLSATYDPTNYSITGTLIDTTLDGNGDASTNIKYSTNFYLLIRTRKASRLPFETGYTMTGATDVTVLASNPADSIYNP